MTLNVIISTGNSQNFHLRALLD